jgi:hypothetical protein
MKAFEDDLVNMMENIQFRNVSDKFLNNLDNDLGFAPDKTLLLMF